MASLLPRRCPTARTSATTRARCGLASSLTHTHFHANAIRRHAHTARSLTVPQGASQVLTQEEYLARYPDEDARYVLAASADWNIDAAEAGSSSLLRYVNHSSSPNCYYHVERVRRSPARRVSFYTLRPVRPGEELLFDYVSGAAPRVS